MNLYENYLADTILSMSEYEAITDRLGREPELLELGLFEAMWSEHCGYKYSRALLKKLPKESNRLLVKPGEENAGVIKINDYTAVIFKVESHNHPTAVEPYQGAATGVGGIVRDILAMGARPIALMNSLRFGDPTTDKQRRLLDGAVYGIADYGNCIGVPNVGGEIFFDDAYKGNPLVNVMCVGLIQGGRILSAKANAPGDLLLLVGSETGRDGIHGASRLASRTLTEQKGERSAVQVGDPFTEKCLIEACLEVANMSEVVGMQDCGAAGITSGAVEMAYRSGMGIEIDIDMVPRREGGMTPYEVLLSESQERMLLAVKPGKEDAVIEIFRKWNLKEAVIGRFTENCEVVIKEGKRSLITTPVDVLADPPQYTFDTRKPDSLIHLQSADPSNLPLPKDSPAKILLRLLASPNIASKQAVFRQYDHQVQNNTLLPPGADSAVLRFKNIPEGLAVTLDGNGRLCHLDPRIGASIAVAEACRNLSVCGAEPIAITNGLNLGNPETDEVRYQLREVILGISDAALTLGVPVVSGNVSLYNETEETAILPTPIIGAVGLLENAATYISPKFRNAGDVIVLLGTHHAWDGASGLPGSEYVSMEHNRSEGKPALDLQLEKMLQSLCRKAIRAGLIKSAHDCSEGGLAVTIAECAIMGGIGATLEIPLPSRWDAAMFGETQSRVVATLKEKDINAFRGMAAEAGMDWVRIGTIGGESLRIGGTVEVPLSEAAKVWEYSFQSITGIGGNTEA